MIIVIGGEKGGTGKTTLATNIAVMRAKAGRDILFVDTDIQGTGSYWCGTRDEAELMPRIPSIQKFGDIKNDIRDLAPRYDDLILDVGGRESKELRASIIVADIAIFPVRPSMFDLWTLARINSHVDSVLDVNPKLKAFVILNAASTHPSLTNTDSEDTQEFINMEDFEHIKLAKSVIRERRVFRKAAITGESVIEFKPQDVKAIDEMTELYKEVFNV
jgi:chromosome partitioning protein